MQAGEPDHALASGQRALAIAADLGDVGLTVTAQHYLGQCLLAAWGTIVGRWSASKRTWRVSTASYSMSASACLVWPLCTPAAHLASHLAECGAFAEGRAPAEEGVRIAEAADHPYSRVLAYWAVGFRSLRQGDLHQAIPVLERGSRPRASGAHPALSPLVAAPLGAAYALAGRTAEALPLLEQAVEQAVAMRLMFDHALRVVWLGEAYLLAGRLDEAYTQAQRALSSPGPIRNGATKPTPCGSSASSTRADPAEVEPAETHYRQALTLAEALGMRPLQAHCHLGLGTLYTRTGQREQARAELSTAMVLYRAMDMHFWLPQAGSRTGTDGRGRTSAREGRQTPLDPCAWRPLL